MRLRNSHEFRYRMRRHSRAAHAGRRRGLNLVEVVVCTILVGVLMISALKTVGAVYRTRQKNVELLDAPALAQQLLTEACSTWYEEPDTAVVFGPESGETTGGTRGAFDDVDDYNAWSESPPKLKDGTVVPGFTGWTRSVTVRLVAPAAPNGTGSTNLASDQDLKRVTVTVTDSRDKTTTLIGLRSRWGAVEQLPASTSTYITWMRGTLQVGTGSTTATSGTNLVNHARD